MRSCARGHISCLQAVVADTTVLVHSGTIHERTVLIESSHDSTAVGDHPFFIATFHLGQTNHWDPLDPFGRGVQDLREGMVPRDLT